MRTRELQRLTVKELHGICEKIGFKEYSGLRKQDLIKSILQSQAKRKEAIYGDGVLEVLSDGYGFLRSPVARRIIWVKSGSSAASPRAAV